MAVTQTAVAPSRPAAIAVAIGVATAALIWAAIAQAGLALLLASIAGLNMFLRAAGATILIVLGARLITSGEAGAAEIPDDGSLGHFYVRGVLVNLSNPNSRLFHERLPGACPSRRCARHSRSRRRNRRRRVGGLALAPRRSLLPKTATPPLRSPRRVD